MSQEKTSTELERENKDLQDRNERLRKEIADATDSLPKDYLDEMLAGKTGGARPPGTTESGRDPIPPKPTGKPPMPQITAEITIENNKNSRQKKIN